MPNSTPLKYAPKQDFVKPLVSVDIIIFTVVDDTLKVLLSKRPSLSESKDEPFPELYCLPGGYVHVGMDMSLHDTAVRKLQEKTGYDTANVAPYLEQLAFWGSAERDPRGWSVTQVYFALLPFIKPTEQATKTDGNPAESNQVERNQAEQIWIQADTACEQTLAFDHNEILQTALNRLRSKVEYTSLPAFLLAEPFTLPQLQRTYEVVLGRKLDKSAFRKRMLDSELLVEFGQIQGGFGRMAMGYKLANPSEAVTFPRGFKSGE